MELILRQTQGGRCSERVIRQRHLTARMLAESLNDPEKPGASGLVDKVTTSKCSYSSGGAARCPCLAVGGIRRGVRQRHLTPPHAEGFSTGPSARATQSSDGGFEDGPALPGCLRRNDIKGEQGRDGWGESVLTIGVVFTIFGSRN